MTTTAVALIPGSTLTAALATYYTCQPNTTDVFKRTSFANTGTGAVTITVNLVRAAGGTVVLIPSQPISPNATYVSPEMAGLTMGAGDSLQMVASTTAVINVVASGIRNV
jgi:hypothetical protein